ncbi:YigZ family protein [uncultured Cohaesibacter sp.]|uniref:IMPACT family protein n=1 Tax=uncultured Cohaesibacter sp. TaxID=1002546 RepID=UPI002AA80044|nr:YigZ family protein [uncultured Cohaesibacter sp.]
MLKTVEAEFFAELEEKKSKFLAFLVPIEQFEARLEALRIEHRKASHHVTAFRLIHEDDHIEEGAKDDGEPAGTSGMPMLKVLIGRDIINCGVIVVRYFGGTKLGAGGLARAYSGVASMALDAATLVPWQRIVRKTVTGRFEQTSEIERKIALLQLSVLDRSYHEAGVDILLEGPEATIKSMDDFMHELNLY